MCHIHRTLSAYKNLNLTHSVQHEQDENQQLRGLAVTTWTFFQHCASLRRSRSHSWYFEHGKDLISHVDSVWCLKPLNQSLADFKTQILGQIVQLSAQFDHVFLLTHIPAMRPTDAFWLFTRSLPVEAVQQFRCFSSFRRRSWIKCFRGQKFNTKQSDWFVVCNSTVRGKPRPLSCDAICHHQLLTSCLL